MRQFKDLGIKPTVQNFSGDKIKIERIVNRVITVLDYKIKDSKFEKGNGKCLYLQITIGSEKHVVFTSSTVLMNQIEQVPKEAYPFETTIIKPNDHYEFS